MARDELDDLIQSRSPSAAQRLGNVLIGVLSALPAAALFVSVFVVDVERSQVTIAAGALIAAALLALSYENLAFARAERMRTETAPPTKASYKGRMREFDSAIKKHEARIGGAALAYSVFYNNALFLASVPFIGCYICADKFSGDLNFLVSAAAAGSLALFNSKSALKAMTA